MSDTQNIVLTVIVASIPGLLVAWLAHQLDVRRDLQRERRLSLNARSLIGLEIDANRSALTTFWTTINGLDRPDARQNATSHLAGMAENGLLSYALPDWSLTRWQGLAPVSMGVFTPAELQATDSIYRGLQAIADLYAKLITITSQEMEILNKDRFWVNRYADWRSDIFARLTAEVERVLKSGNPLRG
jgi:hypothetical protein